MNNCQKRQRNDRKSYPHPQEFEPDVLSMQKTYFSKQKAKAVVNGACDFGEEVVPPENVRKYRDYRFEVYNFTTLHISNCSARKSERLNGKMRRMLWKWCIIKLSVMRMRTPLPIPLAPWPYACKLLTYPGSLCRYLLAASYTRQLYDVVDQRLYTLGKKVTPLPTASV